MYSIHITKDDLTLKYNIDGNRTIIDLKEIISVDIGIEPKYIELSMIGHSGNNLFDAIILRSLGSQPNDRKVLYFDMKTTKAIEENKSMAEMYYPELDFRIDMLLLKIGVNGKELNALLDTGAQITIITLEKAKEVGLEHLIDTTQSREVRGVGASTTIGRIHLYNISIGGTQYPISMEVLKSDTLPEDMIFGLDNMMRLRAVIDIFNKRITFGENKPVELFTLKRKRGIESLMSAPGGKEMLEQIQQMLGMDQQQFENAFNNICGGDPRKFEQLFL